MRVSSALLLALAALSACGKQEPTPPPPRDRCATALPCERTLGVCAGAVRKCIDGVPEPICTAASYGPAYEERENSCDGLDNDCDGEMDVLAPQRLTWEMPPSLYAWDVPNIIPVDGGYRAVGDPSYAMELDSVFALAGSVQHNFVQFPVHPPLKLRPVRDGWAAVVRDVTSVPTLRFMKFDLAGDPEREMDGGLRSFALPDAGISSPALDCLASDPDHLFAIVNDAFGALPRVQAVLTDRNGMALASGLLDLPPTHGFACTREGDNWLIAAANKVGDAGITVLRVDDDFKLVGEKQWTPRAFRAWPTAAWLKSEDAGVTLLLSELALDGGWNLTSIDVLGDGGEEVWLHHSVSTNELRFVVIAPDIGPAFAAAVINDAVDAGDVRSVVFVRREASRVVARDYLGPGRTATIGETFASGSPTAVTAYMRGPDGPGLHAIRGCAP